MILEAKKSVENNHYSNENMYIGKVIEIYTFFKRQMFELRSHNKRCETVLNVMSDKLYQINEKKILAIIDKERVNLFNLEQNLAIYLKQENFQEVVNTMKKIKNTWQSLINRTYRMKERIGKDDFEILSEKLSHFENRKQFNNKFKKLKKSK